MSEHPRLWHFCYPCDEKAYPGRYQCAYLGGVACAVCMVDVPPITMRDAEKVTRERWGWPDKSAITFGGGYADGDATWKRKNRPGSITLMGYGDQVELFASGGGESVGWTLSGEMRPSYIAPMRPLASALDDCEAFLIAHGCPVPRPEDDEEEDEEEAAPPMFTGDDLSRYLSDDD